MKVVLPDMFDPVSSSPVPSSVRVFAVQPSIKGCTTWHGFEVFAVGERRAAGLRVAAQAHDRDGRVGPADEAEHVVDGVAVSRDAAGEAVEKNHLDVERDLHQLECQPSDGRQFVASVALRADDAAAVLDLGDPAGSAVRLRPSREPPLPQGTARFSGPWKAALRPMCRGRC